jgi:acetate kinase
VRIAVLNVGTATVRTALVDIESGEVTVRARRSVESAGREPGEASTEALESLGVRAEDIDAASHRIVHGGTRYTAPIVLDSALEAALEKAAPLAHLLNAAPLAGVDVARRLFPSAPQVAVFDTAFHACRPLESLYYALPRELTDAFALYRYGFQGIAHQALVESYAAAVDKPRDQVWALTLQLGAVCSACAVEGGRSIETSSGFSPLEGLVTTTGCGSLGPGVLIHLCAQGYPPEWIEERLTRRAGLLGLAGCDSVPELLEREAGGEERAALAVRIFVNRIVMTAGAFLTLLNGRGAVVFGGGIGAGSAEIRRRVLEGLATWNVQVDLGRNEANTGGRISADGSRPVYVFETDEESAIARSAARTLELSLIH